MAVSFVHLNTQGLFRSYTSIEFIFHCKGCKLGNRCSSHIPLVILTLTIWSYSFRCMGPAPFATKGCHKHCGFHWWSFYIYLDLLHEISLSVVFWLSKFCSHGAHPVFNSHSSFSFWFWLSIYPTLFDSFLTSKGTLAQLSCPGACWSMCVWPMWLGPWGPCMLHYIATLLGLA
jgi:hypothetical protein